MAAAQVGDCVRIQYLRTQSLKDEVVDHRVPKVLEFVVGDHHIMPGLSVAVTGMTQGEQKRITLLPAEAYGEVQPRLIREIPRSRLNSKTKLKVGMQLMAKNNLSGRNRRVRIVKINRDTVLVDGNHPQAGKTVQWDVQLITVDSSSTANRNKPQFDNGGES